MKKELIPQTRKETIVQTKKFKLEFEKFDDWVYIKCGDRPDPYLLPRKYFDNEETKHAKSKTPYNWLLRILWVNAYAALSEDYLEQYFKEGFWNPINNKTWIVDPLPLLRAGIKNRYYQVDISTDGFLHFNEKPVHRPFRLELREYYPKSKVVEKLQKNPKVLSVKLKTVSSYDRGFLDEAQHIHVVYLPSVREFNKLIATNNYGSAAAQFDIEPRLGIKKFKRGYEY